MKVEIDLGKLLEYYDRFGRDYDLDSGDGFRAFMLDFVCDYEKEQNKDWADDHTNYAKRPLIHVDILFNTPDEAALVLKKMKECIQTKGFVTEADYYIFSNQSSAIQSDYYNWGWRDMKGAYVYSYTDWVDHGNSVYGLKLPDPLPIEHFKG